MAVSIASLKEAVFQYFTIFTENGRIVLDYVHAIADGLFYFFLYLTIGLTLVYLVLSLFAIFNKKRYEEKPYDLKDAPQVTIQIPTRNEIIALRCAQNCLDFDYPKEKFDILIGDDSDQPEVSKAIKEFAAKHSQVQAIKREKNVGFKPGNLNNLLKHTKGDIIVLFDSDFEPQPDFLKRITAPFVHEPETSHVQARWNFNNFDQNLVSILASTIVYIFHHIVLSFMRLFGTSSLCGSAEAVKKKDLVELGGWTSGSLTEDIEYALRLHKAKKKLTYLPNLECYSEVPYKAMDLYKQQMRWAYGVITSYQMHLGGILFNKKLNIKDKLLAMGPGFGYLLPVLIFSLFIFGTISLVTHRPAPLDIPRFLTELSLNTLLTSGLLIASLVSLYKAKKMRYTLKMLLGSFSYGIITTYYVNKGIFKSIFKQPMQWFLLSKEVESKTHAQ